MSTRPRVLVLLAARNGSPWIQQQLQSIADQGGVAVHLAISDDGSIDNTPQLIREFGQHLSIDLHIRRQPSGSAAQNFFTLIRSIDGARYDFVGLADQDDVWAPEKLSRAVAALTDGACAGYSSPVTAVWPDGRERHLGQSTRQSESDYLFEGAGQGCTFVLTAQFYEQVRSFLCEHPHCTEGVHYHDWALYALCRVWNLQWHFDTLATMRYRQHETNDTGARASVFGMTRRFQLIKSGWYSTQLKAIARICSAAAPDNQRLRRWQQGLSSKRGVQRTFTLLKICITGGRRRMTDNAMVLFSIALGWI